jgi:hypothetical protein
MTAEQLAHLATRHAILVSTVLALPHPQDGYDAWRARWKNVTDLVDEIGRMVRTPADAEPSFASRCIGRCANRSRRSPTSPVRRSPNLRPSIVRGIDALGEGRSGK